MEKGKNNFKIAIIGPYPPPYGGISIHVQRMHYSLQEKNFKHVVYTKINKERANLFNIGRVKKWLLRYIFTAKESILHFHNIDWRERVLIGLMGFFGKNVILTIHGESLNNQLNQSNWLKRKILIWAIKNTKNIIAVNPKIKSLLISLGVKPKKVECVPTFIPPAIKDEDIVKIPQEIWDFVDTHNPVISANASRIAFYNDYDLYGIDMCIELCINLKNDYPQMGFILCLPDVEDYEYLEKIKLRIKEKEIENNFIFHIKPCQFYPILIRSNLFVRPTNTDGDSVSLREALYFKIPSIASEAISRPVGTILFRSRDIDDFTLKVKDTLDNYNWYKKKLEEVKLEDNFTKITKIYQKLQFNKANIK